MLFRSKKIEVIGRDGTMISGNALGWSDLLICEEAEVIAKYKDPFLSNYAAITSNSYEKGRVTVIGTIPDQELGESLGNWISNSISHVNPLFSSSESVTISSATSKDNRNLYFVFNWGWETASVAISKDLHDVVSGNNYLSGETIKIESWGVAIFI